MTLLLLLLLLQHEDLVGILITSSAEVPGLLFSLVIVACLGRKIAFALPMVAIAVVLVPLMAGEETILVL
jgi:hypothetical protein